MKKETRLRRLRKLLATLERVREKLTKQNRLGAFRLSFWASFLERDRTNEVIMDVPHADCGFAGCAIGWFLHENHALKMKLGFERENGRAMEPLYDGQAGLDAVCLYFGLTERQGQTLFMSSSYRKLAGEEIDLVIERLRMAISWFESADDPAFVECND